MKIITKRIQTAIKLASVCFIAAPLAQGAVLIGDGINGGELEPYSTSNWDPGIRANNAPDTVEYRTGPGLTATAGVAAINPLDPTGPLVGPHWIDSSSNDLVQNIVNTNLFDIAPGTLATFQIDFSIWAFGSPTRPEANVNFYLGTTLLGTITNTSDTNGAETWSTFTVTDLPVAAGAGQAFRMDTVTAPGQASSGLTLGYALDNVRLSTVPEPSTSLLGVVALGLALGRRRRL
jgi:MYXO-CTERM domain-containing protein